MGIINFYNFINNSVKTDNHLSNNSLKKSTKVIYPDTFVKTDKNISFCSKFLLKSMRENRLKILEDRLVNRKSDNNRCIQTFISNLKNNMMLTEKTMGIIESIDECKLIEFAQLIDKLSDKHCSKYSNPSYVSMLNVFVKNLENDCTFDDIYATIKNFSTHKHENNVTLFTNCQYSIPSLKKLQLLCSLSDNEIENMTSTDVKNFISKPITQEEIISEIKKMVSGTNINIDEQNIKNPSELYDVLSDLKNNLTFYSLIFKNKSDLTGEKILQNIIYNFNFRNGFSNLLSMSELLNLEIKPEEILTLPLEEATEFHKLIPILKKNKLVLDKMSEGKEKAKCNYKDLRKIKPENAKNILRAIANTELIHFKDSLLELLQIDSVKFNKILSIQKQLLEENKEVGDFAYSEIFFKHTLFFHDETVVTLKEDGKTSCSSIKYLVFIYDKDNNLKEKAFIEMQRPNTYLPDTSIVKKQIKIAKADGSSKFYFYDTANVSNKLKSLELYDKNNNLTAKFDESKIDGVYQGESTTEDTIIQENNGITEIKQKFVNPLGITTEHKELKSSDGSRIKQYKITKDNKILLDFEHSLFKNNDVITTITKLNGKTKKYTVHIYKNGETLKIKNCQTGEFAKIREKDLTIQGNAINLNYLAKNLSADDLLTLICRIKEINVIDNELKSNTAIGRLSIGKSNFIISHELGHQKDAKYKISQNKEIYETYKKEISGLNNADYATRLELAYFLNKNKTSKNNTFVSTKCNGLAELVAETNAILFEGNSAPTARTQFLMKYFPETISKIAQMFF